MKGFQSLTANEWIETMYLKKLKLVIGPTVFQNDQL